MVSDIPLGARYHLFARQLSLEKEDGCEQWIGCKIWILHEVRLS